MNAENEKVGGSPNDRFTFLARESQAGIGYVDLKQRFYDPAIGKFVQVDPVTEGQDDQSPYQYGWNSPILHSDPNGDSPQCCSELFDSAMGASTAFIDNSTGINLRGSYSPNNPRAYNTGQDLGDLGSQALGAYLTVDGGANIGGGTTVFASSLTVEVSTGGTASIAAGPAAATGASMIVKGTLEAALGKILIANGGDNFKNKKGGLAKTETTNPPKMKEPLRRK